MQNSKRQFCLLTLLFAVLMSVPFLVPHTGFVALLGFVPLLIMSRLADDRGVKHFFWWYYAAFVLWNAFTTFWVCNATVGGGIFAVLANALQMALIFAVFRISQRKFKGVLPYIFLAAMWIAWERFYFDAEISWPWLVLGNSFARSLHSIQWYEYTGSLGGSLWIWVSNLCLFFLVLPFVSDRCPVSNLRARIALFFFTLLVLILPFGLSHVILKRLPASGGDSMEVYIGQPNFDPYEKKVAYSQEKQNAIFCDLVVRSLKEYVPSEMPALILSPETFTHDIIVDRYQESPTWRRFLYMIGNYPNSNIIFGASARSYIESDKSPSPNARHLRDGSWALSHNSAILLDPTGRTQIFHKSKLVVGTEKTPYPKVFCKIDDMLGGVIGRCVGQDEVSVLNCHSYDSEGHVLRDVPIGSIICYESVFGEYCTEYIRKGAEALVVITNDAWWGNTPGYKQHLSYSCLRAIETRRDIARCANTGISAFIDKTGKITEESQWWVPQFLTGKIALNDEVTFFVQHGDMVGRACTLLFLLLLLALAVRFIVRQ